MKFIKFAFVLCSIILIATKTIAQGCKNYLLLQNGKRIETTIYNKKGEEDGKQIWRVNKVIQNDTATFGTIKCELKDKDGIVISSLVNEIYCNADKLKMNLKMLMTEAQLKHLGKAKIIPKGDYMEYPTTVKVGDKLNDGYLDMNITTEKGIDMNVILEITNRTVGVKESITSTAGTWECYKITSKQKIVSKVAGIGFPSKVEVTEWYAPGVGVIKTFTKNGSTLITSIK